MPGSLPKNSFKEELIRVSTEVIRNSFEDTMDVLEILDEAEQGAVQHHRPEPQYRL